MIGWQRKKEDFMKRRISLFFMIAPAGSLLQNEVSAANNPIVSTITSFQVTVNDKTKAQMFETRNPR